jgi:hypothetical protein
MFGNCMPIKASNGLFFKHFVISSGWNFLLGLIFSLLFEEPNELFIGSKWHAIWFETSSRTASGSFMNAHGLRADPESNMARFTKPLDKA